AISPGRSGSTSRTTPTRSRQSSARSWPGPSRDRAGIGQHAANVPGVSERAPPPADRGDLKSTTYEFFILAMAILPNVNSRLPFIYEFRSQSWWLVMYIECVLTIVFVADFIYRLRTATSKRRYFFRGGGIFDLLSCVPLLRIFRLFRIVRAWRIVRRMGGPR